MYAAGEEGFPGERTISSNLMINQWERSPSSLKRKRKDVVLGGNDFSSASDNSLFGSSNGSGTDSLTQSSNNSSNGQKEIHSNYKVIGIHSYNALQKLRKQRVMYLRSALISSEW